MGSHSCLISAAYVHVLVLLVLVLIHSAVSLVIPPHLARRGFLAVSAATLLSPLTPTTALAKVNPALIGTKDDP